MAKRSGSDTWSGARFTLAVSMQILALLKAWMSASGIRSVYDLALLSDVPRATMHRWFSAPVRLPVEPIRQLVNDLAVHAAAAAEAQRALAELVRLSDTIDPWEQRLHASFRRHGVRVKSAMAAVRAAGLRLVPNDDGKPVSSTMKLPKKGSST